MIKFWMCFVWGIFMEHPHFLWANEMCGSLDEKSCMHALLQNIQDPSKPFHEKEIAEDHFLNLSQKIPDIDFLLNIAKSSTIRQGFAQRVARIILHAGDEDQKKEARRIVYPIWHWLISWFSGE